jgi:hypothetical protein
MKKGHIAPKPQPRNQPVSVDDWVNSGSPKPWGGEEPMKPLTIDVSVSLHTRMKAECAIQGENMADVVRDMLEKRSPKN